MNETTHIRGRVINATARALHIEVRMMVVDPIGYGRVDYTRKAWIPRRFVEVSGDGWEIPTWIAKDRGLLVHTAPGSRWGIDHVPA